MAAADLRVEADVEAAFAAFDATFGRLDAVYGVAGISARRFGDGPIHEATLEGWEAVIAANATSQFLVARAAVRRMLAQAPDAAGSRGQPAPDVERARDATRARPLRDPRLRGEQGGDRGARAGDGGDLRAATGSGSTRSRRRWSRRPMSRRAQDDPAILAYLAAKQPLAGGPLDADAVTAMALVLLGDEARMVTGQVIAVDGGWSVSEGPRP